MKVPRYIVLLAAAIFIFTMPVWFASCGEKDKAVVSIDYDSGAIPSIGTDSTSMLVSDSGIVRYKAIAKTWNMYEQIKDKYWHFPDGLYLEQFDTLFHIVVSVKADSAWYFSYKKLWKLKGNVFIDKHQDGKTYTSQEFYWDQQARRIYSDSLVNITDPNGFTIYATKFRSDEQLTNAWFIEVGRHLDNKTVVHIKEDQENNDQPGEEKTE